LNKLNVPQEVGGPRFTRMQKFGFGLRIQAVIDGCLNKSVVRFLLAAGEFISEIGKMRAIGAGQSARVTAKKRPPERRPERRLLKV
jgi:hypothetical protein